MTEDQFIKSYQYLVDKYVQDASIAQELINRVKAEGSNSAKDLMHNFQVNSTPVHEDDSKLIKEIAFFFI